MRHQASHALATALSPHPPGAVKRMKARRRQLRRVPDIVQERCRHQQLAVFFRDHGRDPARARRARLDVLPALPQRSQEMLRAGRGPRAQHLDTVLRPHADRGTRRPPATPGGCYVSGTADHRRKAAQVTSYRPAAFPVSVKAVIIRDGKVLLLRNERDEWELPGGKLEPGEDPPDRLRQEIAEECGWQANVEPILDAWQYHIRDGTDVLIVTYGAEVPADAGPPVLSTEHKEIGMFAEHEVPGCACRRGTSGRSPAGTPGSASQPDSQWSSAAVRGAPANDRRPNPSTMAVMVVALREPAGVSIMAAP
jgi:ADP-ribose pyrophosphatase YjhB (NUDIX family)